MWIINSRSRICICINVVSMNHSSYSQICKKQNFLWFLEPFNSHLATKLLRNADLSLYEPLLHHDGQSCAWFQSPIQGQGMGSYRKMPSLATCPHELPWRMSPSQHNSSFRSRCRLPFLSHVWDAKIFSVLPTWLHAPPTSFSGILPSPSTIFLSIPFFFSPKPGWIFLLPGEWNILCSPQFLARLCVHTSNPFACSEIRLLEMKVKKTHRSFLLLILIHPSPHTMKQVPVSQVIWLKMVGKADIRRGKESKVNM